MGIYIKVLVKPYINFVRQFRGYKLYLQDGVYCRFEENTAL